MFGFDWSERMYMCKIDGAMTITSHDGHLKRAAGCYGKHFCLLGAMTITCFACLSCIVLSVASSANGCFMACLLKIHWHGFELAACQSEFELAACSMGFSFDVLC